ncbi:MAG TPA: hypothetical protein VJY35_10575 [Candidatus Eisenbacteria bacterium]|nr:hypothetical protein [Candidatus Eisenbacteria bacterium]
MAIHDDELSMLRESLPEYVRLARLGIEFKKDNGGALGYPAATLLFAVVDTIGSHLRKRAGLEPYTVTVGGQQQPIKKTAHHFLVLNSPYFGMDLSATEIERLYDLSRCPLTHNALLGLGVRLTVEQAIPNVIEFREGIATISLPDFLKRCEQAIERFLAEAEKIVAESAAVDELRKESYARVNAEAIKKLEELARSGNWGQSAQASGMGRPNRIGTSDPTRRPR